MTGDTSFLSLPETLSPKEYYKLLFFLFQLFWHLDNHPLWKLKAKPCFHCCKRKKKLLTTLINLWSTFRCFNKSIVAITVPPIHLWYKISFSEFAADFCDAGTKIGVKYLWPTVDLQQVLEHHLETCLVACKSP